MLYRSQKIYNIIFSFFTFICIFCIVVFGLTSKYVFAMKQNYKFDHDDNTKDFLSNFSNNNYFEESKSFSQNTTNDAHSQSSKIDLDLSLTPSFLAQEEENSLDLNLTLSFNLKNLEIITEEKNHELKLKHKREKHNQYQRAYRKNHLEKVRSYRNQYQREYRKNHPRKDNKSYHLINNFQKNNI
ncbi:MAG: putative secreted protein [Candidatus Phytoplasma cynodontis]|uniref:hypothetical protein n=1 Tax='Cynodon dactylon' phytoplasma TaxID=295320 RepID=UPI001265D662|nr:hypothetical protein ['Cynodon dactylon' phytoplasma]WIA07729.1 MAG: putative secreted protein [Candidatus Phytoplasma cynodontis]